MDSRSGRIFPSAAAALMAAAPSRHIVTGELAALRRLKRNAILAAAARKAARGENKRTKARRSMQKASRRSNRRDR
jgi:hypothetical protein